MTEKLNAVTLLKVLLVLEELRLVVVLICLIRFITYSKIGLSGFTYHS